jgi:hypothetical protein
MNAYIHTRYKHTHTHNHTVQAKRKNTREEPGPICRNFTAKQLVLDQELQLAAANGDADRIEALLRVGANITTRRFIGNTHGEHERTPLHVAAYEAKLKVFVCVCVYVCVCVCAYLHAYVCVCVCVCVSVHTCMHTYNWKSAGNTHG